MPKGLCQPHPHPCGECGKTFIRKAPAAKYCAVCKACRYEASRAAISKRSEERRRQDEGHRARRRAASARYRAEDPERFAAQQAAYRSDPNNAAKAAAKTRRWRAENPEKALASKAKYQEENKERLAAKRKSPEAKARRREYEKRYFTTPRRILDRNMSAIIRAKLAGRKAGRSWEQLVGYTLDQLIAHLERQFLPGMTWANRRLWHVDHIIPQSSFRYEGPEDAEFRACWALTNLRPIWAQDNLKKHGHRTLLL